jgi:hypothetical protein
MIALVVILGSGLALAEEGKPLTPVEARKQMGKKNHRRDGGQR